MRRIMGIISVWLLVLSLALPGIAQAATLTYLSGELRAFAEISLGYDPQMSGFWRESGRQDVLAQVDVNLFPKPTIPTPGSDWPPYGRAVASGSLVTGSSSFLNLSMMTSGWGGGLELVAAGAYTYNASSPEWPGYLFFRVDKTTEDTQVTGHIYYHYWFDMPWGFTNYSVLPLAMTINDTYKLAETIYERNGGDRSGFGSGSFDVAIGDIIGIRSFAQDGSRFGIFDWDGSASCRVELKDFSSPVPLPPTLLLLGSGLLGLAGWRRIRKG